ncbi:uncharacterized protein BDCG_08975 [Blastomyces dermatitidis ER-3]|uniref:Uncharacterized protein n=1 Tax=Ajellomyces dermatitidis (strain ER-3 / ATCC MYA-2586) TaxID=559297 RepID=A0ABP2EQ45_AJEDR|nr:uncharacterized protein BDCG_08975 [Blastomyces dermatitidis ER-3]EEQ85706.2 hypothetical protein BDCG_08975 [Blastomyces dermatitidis ER-3]
MEAVLDMVVVVLKEASKTIRDRETHLHVLNVRDLTLAPVDDSETFQMTNLAEVINMSACFVKPHKDLFNRHLYISKDVIFQEDLHLANSLILTTSHNLKVLLNAACKAAAVIPSETPGLLTMTCQETAVIPDSSIDDLFIDEKIQPELQNTLNSLKFTVESDDSSTSTRNITIVEELTVRESSVRDSLEDLLTDSEITAFLILKNLTHVKAFMK